MKSLSVTIQMKATEQHFPVMLYIMLFKVKMFSSADEITSVTELSFLLHVHRVKIPDLFDHIEKMGVSYTIFSTKWFICLFIDVLPVEVST